MSRSRKKKRKSIKIFIILVMIILVLFLGYYFYNKYLENERIKNMVNISYTNDLDIEINSEIKVDDLVSKIENGEVLNGEDIVDTSKLGKNKIEILVKNKDGEEEKYYLNINVIDTTKPVIEGKNEITIYVGNKVNLLDGIKVTDNSKEEIKASVVGEYDVNKVGEYKLKYEASDSSGNTCDYGFTLKVVSDPNNRTFTTSKGFKAEVKNGITYIDGYLIANKTYSLPSTYNPGLLSSTQEAFNKMNADAKALGFNLFIGSGFRSYNDQKYLYNNYVNRDGKAAADTYSARAGHSEHQSGLAFDVCDRNVAACVSSGFASSTQAEWIHNNCFKYGLIIRYPKGKENITGYIYESWHLRYVGVELATKLYNNGDWITLEEYFGIDSKYS